MRKASARVLRFTTVALATLALCAGVLPGAQADDPTVPSRDDIRAAQRNVHTTAQAVGRIKAEFAAADEAVQALEIEAQKAVEAYNGAVYELEQSRTAVRQARRVADSASADVQRMGDLIGAAVVSDSMDGGSLADMGMLLQDPDPDALMDQLSSHRSLTGAMDDQLDEFDAESIVADVLVGQGQEAVDRRKAAAERMDGARQEAQASVDAAEAAAAGLAQRKRELVVELARALDISVKLASERQQALQAKAAKQVRLLAEQQAQEQAQIVEDAMARAYAAQDEAAWDDRSEGSGGADYPTDPAPSGGVEAAVAFALAQVGEPYVWAAAGPGSWDCSGLTMGAWAAGGKALPHYSVAQYESTTPVSMSSLRRGDLLFWSDGGPSSIYHVGLYLGAGMMVHAPRTGRNVEVVSMYYWIPPDLAGRP